MDTTLTKHGFLVEGTTTEVAADSGMATLHLQETKVYITSMFKSIYLVRTYN